MVFRANSSSPRCTTYVALGKVRLRAPYSSPPSTGARQVFPAPEVRRAFVEAGVALEPMDTGAACRTYNVLLGEGRPVGAALIAVG